MLLIMVPGFWMFVLGLATVPIYGDASAAVAVAGMVLMFIGAMG